MSSTAATTTATATSAAAGATTTCVTPSVYDIPTSDVACAVPAGGNHTEVMSRCCGPADVVSYGGGCGLYCLVQGGQTVDDVTACLFSEGIAWSDAFCRGEGNATASATGNSAPTASGASVVGASRTSGASSSSATGDSESGAAPVRGVVSAVGVAVGGLLVSSLVLGLLQV